MSDILFEIKNNVGCITLNRPDKFNAFNRAMALALQQVFDDCANNDNVRAVYLTGNGKAFSAGQDISELVGENKIEIKQILAEHYNPIIERIRAISKPVVCAVNGVAAGAGANIALCCDVVIASEAASFIQAFTKIGLVPDSGGSYFLPRLIGWQKASGLMLTGDKVTATQADKLGMVYQVLAPDVFEQESFATAAALAKMPTTAIAQTKKLLNQASTNTLTQQLSAEDVSQQLCAQTADYAEGINAFLEKRAAIFTGK
jgi:2-(1,2-epoxy-1,2-dihydrophenyl)acetyl-CoA isomerase